MIIPEGIIQNTEAWFIEKAGKPSASKFKKIVTTKGKRSESFSDYMFQLAGETLLGRCEESYQSRAMIEGVEREQESREAFYDLYGEEGQQVGLIYKDKKRNVLCSPDILYQDFGVELKNRTLKKHTKHLYEGKLPYDAIVQVQGSMYVTGFKHWWYFSYYPGIKPFVLLVKRDEAFISKLAKEMDLFVKELREMISKLKKL